MWNKNEWVIFTASFFLIALFTKAGAFSANDMSRMGAIQSIVEQQTFSITNSSFSATVDKVIIDGKFYSDKPALSYLIGVPIYFILHKFGANFSAREDVSYYLITLFTIGFLTSIMLVYFYKLLALFKLTENEKILYVVALGFGTLILPFSLVFNNHVFGATLLLIVFYLVLHAYKTVQFILAGFFAGMAASVDLPAGSIFLIIFFILLFKKIKFKSLFYILGACVPIFLYLMINFHISGSVIPFTLRAELWDYPGSVFGGGQTPGLVRQPSFNILNYTLTYTIGKRGFFSYTPILFFSMAGLIIAMFKNKYRRNAIFVGIGIICTILFYATRTIDFGGCAYGSRYTISLIPLLFLFTPVLFEQKSRFMPFLKMLFVFVLLISILFSAFGVLDPWTCDSFLLLKHLPILKSLFFPYAYL
jgi:hypothetical protein